MDIHDILKIAGGVGALLLFIPMAIQTVKENGAGQNFATWTLWAALDTILAISTIVKHGNYLLPLGFSIGGIAMTIVLLVKRRFAWEKLDYVILGLVVVCLIVWLVGGARTAIIASTLATSVATIPGLIELWQRPQRRVANLWGWYAIANALAFFGGTAMSIEEKFTPAIFTVLSFLMFVAGRRKPAR
jgi:hypothetical protein